MHECTQIFKNKKQVCFFFCSRNATQFDKITIFLTSCRVLLLILTGGQKTTVEQQKMEIRGGNNSSFIIFIFTTGKLEVRLKICFLHHPFYDMWKKIKIHIHAQGTKNIKFVIESSSFLFKLLSRRTIIAAIPKICPTKVCIGNSQTMLEIQCFSIR